MDNQFICEKCNFITSNKKDYKRHLLTKKHIKLNNKTNQKLSNNDKCNENINNNSVMEIIKNLASNQKILTQILNNSNNNLLVPNIINNTTNIQQNNQFNLSVFLNEQCKDAMNLSDFIEQIKISNDDLENIGRNGIVHGLTNIIQRELTACGIYKRPLHCTDTKREVIHIKDEGKWKKDEHGNPTLIKHIEKIGNKCYGGVGRWMNANPNYAKMDTPEYHLWIKIGKNVSISSVENELKGYNKVIKNIALANTISNYKRNIIDY